MKHGVTAAEIMAYKIDQAITALKDLRVTRPLIRFLRTWVLIISHQTQIKNTTLQK